MNEPTESEWTHLHDQTKRNPFFGEVQFRLLPDQRKQVKLIIKPSAELGYELACAALAIDASKSMQIEFGAHLPLPFRKKGNRIQPALLNLANFLTDNTKGKQIVATYWACGDDGKEIDTIGILHKQNLIKNGDSEPYFFSGPSRKTWGTGTHLTPVASYFWDMIFCEFQEVCFALIVTDGSWSDEDQRELFSLTDRICEEIHAGERAFVKFVILAIATENNKLDIQGIQTRFTQLDDYEHPTGIDIWDHKWLHEIESPYDLFVELVQDLSTGIPGKVIADGVECFESEDLKFGFEFIIPAHSRGFTLVLEGGESFYQQIE